MKISVTHRHLANLVYSKARHSPQTAPLRILDAGCGDGVLLYHLVESLPARNPPVAVDVYGFDVDDWETVLADVTPKAVAELSRLRPDTPWHERITVISTQDPWRYPDDFFDVIVSNQVLEHVADLPRFWKEVARTLKPGGFSAHLYPTRRTVVEPHMFVPFAHWFDTYAERRTHILRMLRLGFGNLRHYPQFTRRDLPELAAHNARYLDAFTNYRTPAQMIALAAAEGLHGSTDWAGAFYALKLRSLLKHDTAVSYPFGTSPVLRNLATTVCQWGPCLTLVAEKPAT